MKVQSSTISEINYDGKLLTISFTNGREYVYEGAPSAIYEEFANADSKGKYFHENINYRYNYTRIK
jgi:hypothetical protein